MAGDRVAPGVSKLVCLFREHAKRLGPKGTVAAGQIQGGVFGRWSVILTTRCRKKRCCIGKRKSRTDDGVLVKGENKYFNGVAGSYEFTVIRKHTLVCEGKS